MKSKSRLVGKAKGQLIIFLYLYYKKNVWKQRLSLDLNRLWRLFSKGWHWLQCVCGDDSRPWWWCLSLLVMIITISHQDLNICMDCGLCGPRNVSLAARADESLPSNIAGGFLRFLHFIYFATSVNEFIFLFLERSLQILFILAGERFAEECEKGKWKNIAAYWTLL